METEFCMVAPTERGRCQMPNVTIVRAVQCKTTMLKGLLESVCGTRVGSRPWR